MALPSEVVPSQRISLTRYATDQGGNNNVGADAATPSEVPQRTSLRPPPLTQEVVEAADSDPRRGGSSDKPRWNHPDVLTCSPARTLRIGHSYLLGAGVPHHADGRKRVGSACTADSSGSNAGDPVLRSGEERTMTDLDRSARLRDMFDELWGLDPSGRAARLDEVCSDDPDLRRDVESLLEAADRRDSGLGRVLEGLGRDNASPVDTSFHPASDGSGDVVPRALQEALKARYTIEREVGRGGMATVYLAEDLKHHRRVAIKVLHPHLASSIGPVRFLREIELVAGLTHPHILALHDSGEVDGYLFYVMPYVDGESLGDLLAREGKLEVPRCLGIVDEVADALAHAHSHGVIHRDVKPSNILLSEGHAVLTDFGVARSFEGTGDAHLTQTGSAIGTPTYMAPEQADGSQVVDERADIYALGCLVYEMLAGGPPFSGATPQIVMAKHLAEEPPSLALVRPAVPAPLVAAVHKALAKNPDDRFVTVPEFLQALRVPARWGMAGLVRKSTSRNGALAVLAAIIGIALVPELLSRGQPSSGDTGAPESNRIAVLYFQDRSPDGVLGDLAIGLTEDLIDRLDLAGGLDVINARAIQPLSGQELSPDSIARLLGVGTVVDGTVGLDGDAVTATVRLVDPSTNVQANPFSVARPIGEPLALQEEIAELLARGLRVRIGREINLASQRNAASNDLAWELFRRGQGLQDDARTLIEADDLEAAADFLARADSAFARAEELDPSWLMPTLSRGWVKWDEASLTLRASQQSLAQPSQDVARLIQAGLTHGNRAIDLQAGNSRALELRGSLRFRLAVYGERAQAGRLLDSALVDLNAAVQSAESMPRAWGVLSEVHTMRGDVALAMLAAEKAREADHYLLESRNILRRLFNESLHREAYGDAARWCESGQTHHETDPVFLECELTILGWNASQVTDAALAWELTHRLDSIEVLNDGRPHRRLFVAAVLARAGLADSARTVIERTRAETPERIQNDLSPMEALVRTALGEDSLALDLLAVTLLAEPQRKAYVASHPWYERLRSNPRFIDLVSGT